MNEMPPGPPMPAQTKTSPLAIGSLVLGILAILLSPVLIGFLLTVQPWKHVYPRCGLNTPRPSGSNVP